MSAGLVPERAVAPAGWPPLQLLWEDEPSGELRGHGMPDELARLYGGPLLIALRADPPWIVANFVSTLDGVVTLGPGKLSGGALISGFHEADRFGMGLLRALADVVVVGAGTLRASKTQRWTPGNVHPGSADAFADWRRTMGLAAQPTTVIVTAGGDLPIQHAGLNDPNVPVVIATTARGAERLADADLAPHVVVETMGSAERIAGHDIAVLGERLGARVVLCEGGPHLIGELVAADVLDELFLTVAPQLVGRAGNRLGLVEGVELVPPDTRWHDLVAVRRSGSHLFLRYRRRPDGHQAGEA